MVHFLKFNGKNSVSTAVKNTDKAKSDMPRAVYDMLTSAGLTFM